MCVMGIIVAYILVSLAECGFSLVSWEPRKTYEVWIDGFRAIF